MKKVEVNKLGRFELERRDKSDGFMCDRCLQPKISKIQVVWRKPDGAVKTLCNGCYGRIVSEARVS